MAVLDPTTNEIVIRVVYDGPAEAGKTTSIRALATSFSQPTVTPEEDATGRTQWFDWMEYVGGRFEGSQIRCQIVSVPGQAELAGRRKLLLASADVVVFVGDTTRARWPATLDALAELQALRSTASPEYGIVFQANKRDLPGAMNAGEIREQLGDARWEVGLVESIASDGTGIREAFVYAVRLALDRVRELVSRGLLREARPDHLTADTLYAHMRELEAPPAPTIEAGLLGIIEAALEKGIGSLASEPPRILSDAQTVAATLIQEVLAAEVDPVPSLPPIPAVPAPKLAKLQPPKPPDATVPSGAIWPPVEGRAILMEVSAIELQPRRHANGDWSAGLGSGWRLVSKREATFESLDSGRSALVQWARLHAACTAVVSPRRCIVLAATGDGSWRLWQIVRAEESLRDLVERAREAEGEEAFDNVFTSALLLLEVHERLATAPCDLPCSLDTVGACEASGMYIGLMPETPSEPTSPRVSPYLLLEQELGPMLASDLAGRRRDLERGLNAKGAPSAELQNILSSLRALMR